MKGKREEIAEKKNYAMKRTRKGKHSLSTRWSKRALVQRQGANEIVGYVLSTAA